MDQNEFFYKKMAEVPELPGDIFPKIEEKVEKKRHSLRSYFAIAASLLIVFGVVAMVQVQRTRRENALVAASEQLQEVEAYFAFVDLLNGVEENGVTDSTIVQEESVLTFDYFSPEYIDQDFEMYTFIDLSLL